MPQSSGRYRTVPSVKRCATLEGESRVHESRFEGAAGVWWILFGFAREFEQVDTEEGYCEAGEERDRV